jgi:hypothetical protein
MMAAARKNLMTEITNGCPWASAFFVAVDAEPHKIAKAVPAEIIFRLEPFVNEDVKYLVRKLMN